jgi:hypothetical protein
MRQLLFLFIYSIRTSQSQTRGCTGHALRINKVQEKEKIFHTKAKAKLHDFISQLILNITKLTSSF